MENRLKTCSVCNRPISLEEYDNFSKMCASCENEIIECHQCEDLEC